jgi:hypothetical protein
VPAAAGFVDVSAAAGFDINDVTFGAGWADFDGDGNLDVLVCRHYFRPLLYRNLGDGTFNYSFFPPLFDMYDHHGPLLSDFDDDGDVDIYLTGGADAGTSTSWKPMYRNDGDFSFVDVAAEWGVADSLSRGRSSSAIDVEGDGDVDFFVAKARRVISPNSLFINVGNQTYTDEAASAGIADDFGSVGGLWGDYDRDGDPDLLIGGEETADFETRLYRNEGNVSFVDVTDALLPGIGQIASAAWADYDEDGDLDLAIGRGDHALFDAMNWDADSVSFFFNSRNGDDGVDALTFLQTGDSTTYELYFNGFYWPELVFISETGYHPPQTSPFTLSEDIRGAPDFAPGESTGFYLWTDEVIDIWEMRTSSPPATGNTFAGYLTANGSFTSVSLSGVEPYTHGERGTRLYRNDGTVFTNVSVLSGLTDTVNVRHVAWVDLDQDGSLDLHVLNKGDTQSGNGSDVFYRGNSDGTFRDATATWNLTGPANGLADAVAYGDYDADGDLDLVLTSGTGPRALTRREIHRLYRNDGPVGNWLEVDLVGLYSTREGHGAWVTCVSATAGRQTRYVTGNAWRGCQEYPRPRFGLGADALVDSLRIEWPSGVVDVLAGFSANRTVTIFESFAGVEAPVRTPSRSELALRVLPNPTPRRGPTVLRFEGRREEKARLEIFDAAGRRVVERTLPPGVARFVWTGNGSDGRPSAAGVYFARIREGDRVAAAKIVRIGR